MKKKNKVLYTFLLFWLSFSVLADQIADPTRPPNFTTANKVVNTGQPLVLNAVFIYPNRRYAIISGQTVLVGDKIGEFTITSIKPYTVELLGPQNRQETLQLVTPVKERLTKEP